MLLVMVRDPRGRSQDTYLFTTDLMATAEQVIRAERRSVGDRGDPPERQAVLGGGGSSMPAAEGTGAGELDVALHLHAGLVPVGGT